MRNKIQERVRDLTNVPASKQATYSRAVVREKEQNEDHQESSPGMKQAEEEEEEEGGGEAQYD